jgi:hypothetical protein
MMCRVLAVVALSFAAGTLPAMAQAQKPLPMFRVVSGDGAEVESASLVRTGRWLVMYMVPSCRPCDLLLTALKDWQSPQLLARTVVLVGAERSAGQEYIRSTVPAEVGAITWFADATGEAWQALGLHGTPVLIGVQDGEIRWAVSGVLNDPQALESVVRTWVEH